MQQNDVPQQPRRQSVPRKSLEKPLPVPNAMQSQEIRPQEKLQEKLPFRERAPAQDSFAQGSAMKASATNGNADQSIPTPSVSIVKSGSIKSFLADHASQSPIRSGQYARGPVQSTSASKELRSGPQQIYKQQYLVAGSPSPPSLAGIVDPTNTVDTTTDVRYAART